MSAPVHKPGDPAASPGSTEAPGAPAEAEWAAMSPAGREQAVGAVLGSEPEKELDRREATIHGDPHLDAGAGELVGELGRMLDPAEARIDHEQARAEQEQARAERAVGNLSAAILVILGVRGVPTSEEARRRILRETDLGVLDRWLKRAATAAAAEDLFREPAS
ncbi:hypothetical protein WMF37_17710 [Sorangium sp. So ce291]|uniref:hypothetical protein n=1 Tax=Sorangium sp. So ce291 TaxID=3133294 RepID=UPI003F6069F0